jgi:PadR family transcriptional regulator PadR
VDAELIKGTLSLLVLSLLSRRRMYGYEIVTTVRRETGGAFEWKEGSLYPCLHKLERDGLVRGQWRGRKGGRRRKYYHLTEAGRTALAEKTESWRRLRAAMDRILERSHERA